MPRPILFISDLHLSPARPGILSLFLEFLRAEAASAESLYILGDLFEYWIGDDAADALGQGPVLGALRDLVQQGVPVFVMGGNRDFLVGSGFSAATGCRVLRDPCRIEIRGTPTVLMHGDLLCTGDQGYLAWRRFAHNPVAQRLFLTLPHAARAAIGRRIRRASETKLETAPRAIMDVSQPAVDEVLRRFGARLLIHGHTHRPAIHSFQLDGQEAARVVLGDWYSQGSVLRWTEGGYTLASL